MTKQQYEKISQPFRSEKAAKWLNIVNTSITSIGYASYPLILVYLFFAKFPVTALYATVVPASGFILLTFFQCCAVLDGFFTALENTILANILYENNILQQMILTIFTWKAWKIRLFCFAENKMWKKQKKLLTLSILRDNISKRSRKRPLKNCTLKTEYK